MGKNRAAMDGITALLDDRKSSVRLEGLRAAGLLGKRELAPHVAARLEDTSVRVREMAVWALGHLGARQYGPEIRSLLNEKDLWTRCHAAESLAWLGQKRFIPDIARLLEDPRGLVRGHALLALGDLSASGLERQMARHLTDRHWGTRGCAAMALAQLNARSHLPQTMRILDSPRTMGSAVTALNMLRDRNTYRRLKGFVIVVRKQDRFRDVLGRLGARGIRTRIDADGARWASRPFTKYRKAYARNLYMAFWDLASDFRKGGVGYIIEGGVIQLTNMQKAVAESRDWALRSVRLTPPSASPKSSRP